MAPARRWTRHREGAVIFLLEVTWFSHRALVHLIVSGALERHPGLQLVFTEQGTDWMPDELARLDYFFDRMRTPSARRSTCGAQPVMAEAAAVAERVLGPPVPRRGELHAPARGATARTTVGLDRIMWGTDYPHKEASFPFTHEALRAAFAGVPPDEVAMMLGGNAAGFYGFDLAALRPIAGTDRPASSSEIDVPLQPRRRADVAEKCPALAGFGATLARSLHLHYLPIRTETR